jgi:SET domain-containing protein
MGPERMGKGRPVKTMFSLSPVEFRDSPIAGRGVFARRHFRPGDVVTPYAPKQRRLDARDPEAIAASATKLTLLSERRFVIVPDTSVPGGWLCNHSCDPNAAIFSDRQGRIQCTRPIAPGDEVTIFYGWVSHNEPERDPCCCGSPKCRGFINFDLSDEDAARTRILPDNTVELDDVLRRRLAQYSTYLSSIGQEQVNEAIADTLVRMKLRKTGS